MASGSSSSSSSAASSDRKKKKKKEKKKKKGGEETQKKAKKDKKADKKAKKSDKKADKRAKAAEEWECDRAEAVRLLAQLLVLDAGIADELGGVFESIDGGDAVRIDGLENKQAKKKLRHLLQAFKLPLVDGTGFRTASKKVSFSALFESCLDKARQSLSKAASGTAAAASPAASPSVADTAAAASASAAEEAPEQRSAPDSPRDGGEAQPAAGPRKVGPQLPGASVGPAAGDDASSSDEGPVEAEPGPRAEGAERKGVDLDSMPRVLKREDWMTTPHESIAGAFGEARGRKRDRYEVSRSKEEQEAFEKMFKARGPSLLQEKMDNKFAGHEEEMEKARKHKPGANDVWGLSAREQEQGAAGDGQAASQASRRPFDPEQDLTVRKPITGADFSKMVENSASGLAGRFSRSQVATSFL